MLLPMRGRSLLLIALTLLARTLALQQLDILSAAPSVYTYFQGHPIANNPALFGSPPYGSSITGRLLYARDAQFACTNFTSAAVPNWPTAPEDPSQPAPSVILLVDRGSPTPSDPCTFVEKVYYGQQAGASAVVVVNTQGDALPYMKSDGSELSKQITIPAMIIGYDDGQRLEAEAVKPGTGDQVMARLKWGLPHPDDHVEWSLWLTPTNLEAKAFLTALSSVSDALGNDASFVPQYFLKKAGCPSGLSYDYCSYDPLPDPNPNDIDDDMVIEETVRQLCVFQVSNGTGRVGAWWRYMAHFYKECYSSFSEDCSKRILNTLWIPAASVDRCVRDSWSGQSNSLLDQQFSQKGALGAWISPTLYINSEPFAGSLYCGGTVKQSNCPPLRALCAGFFEDSRPAMCDCDVLGAVRDECGVCGGNNGCKAAAPEASGGMSWSTLAVIAVVVAAVGGLVFFAYTRRQRRLARLEIDEILRRYVPLGEDGKPATSAAPSGSGSGSGGGRHEFGEEDDEEEHITHLTAGIGSALRSDSTEPTAPAKQAPPPSAGAVAAAAPRTAFAIDDHEEDGEQEV